MAGEVVEVEILGILSQIEKISIKGKKEVVSGEMVRGASLIREKIIPKSSKSLKVEISPKMDAEAEVAVFKKEVVSEVAQTRQETSFMEGKDATKILADKNLTDMVRMKDPETPTMTQKDPLEIIGKTEEVTMDQFSAEEEIEAECEVDTKKQKY